MTTSNTYRADSAPAHGGHHLVDGLMRCDACWGVCLPQWRCRCCLEREVEALRAQVARVREKHTPWTVCEFHEGGGECDGGTSGDHYHKTVCRMCCTDEAGFDQTEECANYHSQCWPCDTLRALDGTDE